MKIIKVPTGVIATPECEFGPLECLSLADYGQDKNVKADFLGITRKIYGVDNGPTMPLSEKWVVTLSTQYGCSMGCNMCDVPSVGPGRNASLKDLNRQFGLSLLLGGCTNTKRLNVHYARMGEPTWNRNVIRHASRLRQAADHLGVFADTIHPVVSTMMPKENEGLEDFISGWIFIKNAEYRGEAGLQLSINTTNPIDRRNMFNNNSMRLQDIAKLMDLMPDPVGRKYTLNFAVHQMTEIDARLLADLFHPDRFMCKITPTHFTWAAIRNGLCGSQIDPGDIYAEHEENLKDAGYDVLVFYPSCDEDLGMITCGNAILSGEHLGVKYEEIQV